MTSNYSGRILSTDLLPLANVSISPAGDPWDVLAMSDDNGDFEVVGFCEGQKLEYRVDGYVPAVEIVIDSSTRRKRLTDAGGITRIYLSRIRKQNIQKNDMYSVNIYVSYVIHNDVFIDF